MAARGLLNSGNTIKHGHEALVEEIQESRKAVVNSFSEHLEVTKPSKIVDFQFKRAFEILEEQKDFLEEFYQEQMNAIVSNLKNQQMISRYSTVDEVKELNKRELNIELSRARDNYLTSQGKNLLERVKNQFLNRPIIVIGIITIAVVSAVLTFFTFFGVL